MRLLLSFNLSFTIFWASAQTVEAEIDSSFYYEFNSLKGTHEKVVTLDFVHNTIFSEPIGEATVREMLRITKEDGFRLNRLRSGISRNRLDSLETNILIIHGPVQTRNNLEKDSIRANVWISPFSNTEITELSSWIFQGGSLYLFVSHHPNGGGANNLLDALGINYRHGAVGNEDKTCGHYYMNVNNRLVNSSHPIFKSNYNINWDGFKFLCGSGVFREDSDVILKFPESSINFSYSPSGQKSKEVSSAYAGMIGFEYGLGRVIICTDQGIFRSLNIFPEGQEMAKVTIHDKEADNAALYLMTLRWLAKLF